MTLNEFYNLKIGSKVLLYGKVQMVDGVDRRTERFSIGFRDWYSYRVADYIPKEGTVRKKPKVEKKPKGCRIKVSMLNNVEFAEFPTMTEASTYLGIPVSVISVACKRGEPVKVPLICEKV